MTIKNIFGLLALFSVSPIGPSYGLDLVSDFSNLTLDPNVFTTDFTAAPVGVAFQSDFAAETYAMASEEVYGRFKLNLDTASGTHSLGTTIVVLRNGFESDFMLYGDPQIPAEYANVVVTSDFTQDQHIVETYPPPTAFDTDFSDPGVSFDSNFLVGNYLMATTDTVYGRYQFSSGDNVLSGTPILLSRPFVIEQHLPGTIADDRLGYFRLGATTLGGEAI